MWRSNRRLAVSVSLLLAVGCAPGAGDGTSSARRGPAGEARALMEQGQLDAALARLEGAPSEPEVILVQGLVWMKKAEQAPAPEPEVEGEDPPEFKLEERNALAFFETLTAAGPHAEAHLAIAELLQPHALEKAEADRSRRRRRRASAAPPPDQPDFSPERIVREIEAAATSDPTAVPAEALIAFCAAVEGLDCGERGYRMLLERQPESAEPHHRFGNFLLQQRKNGDAAIQQYELGLVWAPDETPEDAELRGRVADIFLDRAREQLDARRWANADQHLKSARKYLSSASAAAQAQRAAQMEAELVQKSGRRF